MKEQKDNFQMLELMLTPAFSVRDGRIVHVNQAARQLLIQPDTEICQLIPRSFAAYQAFTDGCLYLTVQLPGGDIGASVIHVDGANIFMLEQEQTELRALALAAQDLRPSIADIIGLTEQLSPYLEKADRRPQLAQLNQKLSQLKRLVLNMADASRYAATGASRMPIVDVCSLVSELFQRIGVYTEAAGITLQTSVPAEQALCQIDEEKLERAVYNLVSNAMKASKPGGVIEAKLSRNGNTLYLSVQDNGEGIAEPVLGSIFSRYLRQPGLESGQDGLGLGMVMVRTAAAVHGGTVLVTQRPEGGTRIIMSIPIRTEISGEMRSPALRVDYAGEKDHSLLELSDVLPTELYTTQD